MADIAPLEFAPPAYCYVATCPRCGCLAESLADVDQLAPVIRSNIARWTKLGFTIDRVERETMVAELTACKCKGTPG